MNLLKKTFWIVFFNGLFFLGSVFPGTNDFVQQGNSIGILDTRLHVKQLFLCKFLNTTKVAIVHKLQGVVSSGDYDELKDELLVDLRACQEAIKLVEEIVNDFNMGCMAYNPEPKIRFVGMCNVLHGVEYIESHNVRKQLKFVEFFNKYIISYFISRKDFLENKDRKLFDKLISLNQKLINNILKNDYLDIDFVDKAIDWFIHQPWELFCKYKFVPIVAGVTVAAAAVGVPLWLLNKGKENIFDLDDERLQEILQQDGEVIPPSKPVSDEQEDLDSGREGGVVPAQEIFCGIRNLRNTCFINSLTQCLLHCPIFLNSLLRVDTRRRCLDRHFIALVRSMSMYKCIRPTSFVSYIWNLFPTGDRGRQNCAAECLSLMLDRLLTDAVKNTFQCSLESRTTCGMCGRVSRKREPGVCISCSIPPRRDNNDIRVQDCWDRFFDNETLQPPNAYACGQCGGLVSQATKQLRLSANPEILVIHLKCFDNHRNKIHRPTLVEEELALGGRRYCLRGVVLHKGPFGGGHYTALAKEASRVVGEQWRSGKRWIWCDDSLVKFDKKENGFREQLRTNGYIGGWRSSYTPYLLFYERIEE